MAATSTTQRLEKLHYIEQDIGKMLSLAADAVEELSKENPSSEVVEYKTKDFLRTLQGIEKSLSEEISYLTKVSTTHPHEGSVYGAEKDYELATQQTSFTKERLQQFTDKNWATANVHK